MKRMEEKAPFKVQTVLTDNGKSFTDRFTWVGERKPSGRHLFDQECQVLDIEHRLIKRDDRKRMVWWSASPSIADCCDERMAEQAA